MIIQRGVESMPAPTLGVARPLHVYGLTGWTLVTGLCSNAAHVRMQSEPPPGGITGPLHLRASGASQG